MKICEEKIPPLMVFQELFNENVLFARGINWLYPDKTEEQRLMGFANISSELLMTGKTLGEYLTEAVMYSKSPLFAAIVKEPTEARKKALAYDIALIKKIVKEYTAAAVKKALSGIEGATADYAALPEYESGKFTLTADRLIKFAQKNGTGDFAKYKAFTFRGGKLIPVEHIDPIRLSGLKNYELQRNQVVENTIAFLNGLPAQNALEVLVLDGTGKTEFTGSLGDVMKESAKIAVSLTRSLAKKYNIDPEFYKNKDIHVHAPEGAVPKDGPSAGVTLTTALVSALSGTPVRRDVAMTGEITLRGKVLAIGGLKEKTMAAYRAGVKTVCIPKENEPDIDELDEVVKSSLKFVVAEDINTVLETALVLPNCEPHGKAPLRRRSSAKTKEAEKIPALTAN